MIRPICKDNFLLAMKSAPATAEDLATAQDLLDTTQREHPLIDPMEMDDVGLLECFCVGDVHAGVGDGNGEEVFAAEAVGCPNDEALPKEAKLHVKRLG